MRSTRRSPAASLASYSATGTGWYGEPRQHGGVTPPPHGVIERDSSCAGRPSTAARRSRTARPSPGWRSRAVRSTDTTIAVRLRTSGVPRTSSTAPRGAASTTGRTRLALAASA